MLLIRCAGALVLLLVLVLALEFELGLFDAVSAEAPKAQGAANTALSMNNNVILGIRPARLPEPLSRPSQRCVHKLSEMRPLRDECLRAMDAPSYRRKSRV
jgi:hypothetical protein